jgi:hypothetical protein
MQDQLARDGQLIQKHLHRLNKIHLLWLCCWLPYGPMIDWLLRL